MKMKPRKLWVTYSIGKTEQPHPPTDIDIRSIMLSMGYKAVNQLVNRSQNWRVIEFILDERKKSNIIKPESLIIPP